MPKLTQTERRALLDRLLSLPNIEDPQTRRALLAGLPRGLLHSIPYAPAPAVHLTAMVDAVVGGPWERLADGSLALAVLLDNAAALVPDTALATELAAYATRLAAPPVVPPPAATAAPAGTQGRLLQDALLSAFPSYADLAAMVRFGLGESLPAVAGDSGAPLRTVVFQLIEWAAARDRLGALLRAAREANPDNALLRAQDGLWRDGGPGR